MVAGGSLLPVLGGGEEVRKMSVDYQVKFRPWRLLLNNLYLLLSLGNWKPLQISKHGSDSIRFLLGKTQGSRAFLTKSAPFLAKNKLYYLHFFCTLAFQLTEISQSSSYVYTQRVSSFVCKVA